jgi:uncharacterized damage-inducible protein DinB
MDPRLVPLAELLRLNTRLYGNCLAGLADGGFNDIAQVTSYPSLADMKAAWTAVSEKVDRRLQKMTAAELDKTLDPGFPMDNKTVLGVFSFMVQHDSYHLGQLGLLRKHAGLPAMSYD